MHVLVTYYYALEVRPPDSNALICDIMEQILSGQFQQTDQFRNMLRVSSITQKEIIAII